MGMVLQHQTRRQVAKLNDEGPQPIVEIVRTWWSSAALVVLVFGAVCFLCAREVLLVHAQAALSSAPLHQRRRRRSSLTCHMPRAQADESPVS